MGVKQAFEFCRTTVFYTSLVTIEPFQLVLLPEEATSMFGASKASRLVLDELGLQEILQSIFMNNFSWSLLFLGPCRNIHLFRLYYFMQTLSCTVDVNNLSFVNFRPHIQPII